MTQRGFAPGKIILSGEYAMLFGEPGVAVPWTEGITATFEENARTEHLDLRWKEVTHDSAWAAYLRHIVSIAREKTDKQPRDTLDIRSSIPLGKGMGASTALVIAVSRALLGDDCREEALSIEDVVNPGHSGMDFAVIWEGRPLKFQKDKPVEFIEFPKDFLTHAILIDTGTPGETTPELASWVKENYSHKHNNSPVAEIRESPLRTIGHCTERLLSGESPLAVFPDHHRAQVALGVVPKPVQRFIEDIEKSGGAAKVIGAGARTGGAGIVLALHESYLKVENLANRLDYSFLGLLQATRPNG